MKESLPFLLLLFVFFTACPDAPTSTIDAFNGKWEMQTFAVFSPDQPIINPGAIVWEYKSTTQKVDIVNTIHNEYPYIKKSGNYDYTVVNDSQINVDGKVYDYKFQEGKLIFSDKPELDGPIFTFKKME